MFRFLNIISFLFFVSIFTFSITNAYPLSDYFKSLFQRVNFGGLVGPSYNYGNFFTGKENNDKNYQSEVNDTSLIDNTSNLLPEEKKNEDNKAVDMDILDIPLNNTKTSILSKLLGTKSESDKKNNEEIVKISQTKAEEIKMRENEFGKQYIPTNSPLYSKPAQDYSSPQSVDQFYAQNPGLVGKSDNPSVWNGDPATRPQGSPNQSNPIPMNSSNFLKSDGDEKAFRSLQDGRFKITEDGWFVTLATNFGLGTNGSQDTGLVNYALGCPTAMSSFSASGPVRVCNKHVAVIGIPPDVMDYLYGQTNWKNRWDLGGPYKNTIGGLYRKIAGTPFEVVNKDNNKCTVVPLWETGPSKQECSGKGCGIDLTYNVKVVLLQSTRGKLPVQYRPVPQGKRGCEGFDYVPAVVKQFVNKNNPTQ